ncbi:MAG: DNA polymerase III subunit alpha [Planctomycetota bacterium]
MSGPKFCHLHTHTQYSLLDGASRLSEIIKRARQMNQPALAITDHGNMFGAIEFYRACMETAKTAPKDGLPPLKPIIGMETYVVPDGKSRSVREKIDDKSGFHLILWASNEEGYKNLMKLSSLAYLEGFYYKPRVDRELLARYSKGLLAASGCISSEIPQTVLKKDYAAALRMAGVYQEIFGKDNFYFELQDHGAAALDAPEASKEMRQLAEEQKKVNESVICIARATGGKLICTNDSHYTSREDAAAHDVLLCIDTGKLLSDRERMEFPCDEFYLKSSEEMEQLFGSAVPEALQNTLEIAERCNLGLKFGTYHFPAFQVPGGEEPNVFFRRQVAAGLKRRYGDPVPALVQARAQEELRVLEKMGFVGYLLIVWDIVREARARGLPVGPGRGSAAGSVVCYALGITGLEPLRYNLLFERFVNEGRNEMPDIDIDFCQSRRGEVIEYVQNKYGRDCTANIITFNAMQAKSAVRDVGRVLGRQINEVNNITKLIPLMPNKKVTLQAAPAKRASEGDTHYAVDDEPELAAAYAREPATKELIDMARKCEGIARNTGCHPAGLVIADKPVVEYCPLFKDKNGLTLTQYEMSHIDAVGLLKIDFLGLETLTKLEVTRKLMQERHGSKLKEPLAADGLIDLQQLPLDDAKTYRMMSRGDSCGVFQFESDGMRKMLVEAAPDCLEDLVALNAMFRPGPLQNIPAFCKRKHGQEQIEYLVPQLEPILKDTYGVIVYQEQVMQIANQLAGFTLSEADKLRKAMGKKKPELMAKYAVQFVEGCAQKGINKEKATKLYELIAKFAEYGFNRSHAAAYALLAYQTAYLKANYPAEFMAGNMSLELGNTDKLVLYIEECRRMGLEIRKPDINDSGERFLIKEEKVLLFPLGAIQLVGDNAVNSILEERKKNGPFRDLFDFCERLEAGHVNKGCLANLIKAGALDSIAKGCSRPALIDVLDEAMSNGAVARLDRNSGQGSLFGGDEPERRPFKLSGSGPADWTVKERLAEEKKVLGFYFSGHPLDEVRELVEGLSSSRLRELAEIPEGYTVVAGALVTQVRNTVTREKGEKMAVLNIEDFSGSAQVVVTPRIYNECKPLQQDSILFFRGRLKLNEPLGGESGGNGGDGEKKRRAAATIMADQVMTVDQAAQRYVHDVWLSLGNLGKDLLQARLDSVLPELQKYRGQTPVFFQIEITDPAGRPALVNIRAGEKRGVRPVPDLLASLRHILSPGAVRVSGAGTQAQKAPQPQWRQRR